ncbi:MAG: T9SS type A sorting domain-containing protein [candidate division WOR-3 bacterium]|nr:T9SS type A sorting domain-containing protein [candidate division WOR-3 bacterium]MDW8150661.1 T9SS type A sorting domain-containing protein [candidate division WOR-3 bacterium]
MKKLALIFLILLGIANAKINLEVESTVIRKNQSAIIYAQSDKPSILSIYDNTGKITFSAINIGNNVYKVQLQKKGIYIIILKEQETSQLKRVILVLP